MKSANRGLLSAGNPFPECVTEPTSYDQEMVYMNPRLRAEELCSFGDDCYAKASKDGFYDQKNLEQALHYYKLAIAKDPTYAAAYNNLGNAYVLIDKLVKENRNIVTDTYSKAMSFYDQAIDNQKDDKEKALYYFNRGVAKSTVNLFDQAITDFKTTISLDPHFAEAHARLGRLYDKKGQIFEAITHYCIAIDLKFDTARPFLLSIETKKIISAIEDEFKNVKDNDPNSPAKINLIKFLKNCLDSNTVIGSHLQAPAKPSTFTLNMFNQQKTEPYQETINKWLEIIDPDSQKHFDLEYWY